jgi:hypothetical protein
MAKLLVPFGTPLQVSDGDILPPVHPKPLNTCSSLIVAPSLTSALFMLIFCAWDASGKKHPSRTAIWNEILKIFTFSSLGYNY